MQIDKTQAMVVVRGVRHAAHIMITNRGEAFCSVRIWVLIKIAVGARYRHHAITSKTQYILMRYN